MYLIRAFIPSTSFLEVIVVICDLHLTLTCTVCLSTFTPVVTEITNTLLFMFTLLHATHYTTSLFCVEYNPNKHCGVWIEEERRHCVRSLTCKVSTDIKLLI